MNATITLDTGFNRGPIDRRLFGGFLEHLGRAVYQGVYDPGNPRSDAGGFRQDVLGALKTLGLSPIRYPGGNYVSAADWKDGIGPPEARPRRPDYGWRSIETNQFGVDEFMSFCERLGSEPLLAVNLGTLSAKDAAELVEYVNFPGGTAWSDRRRQHGRSQPYGVKLWGLGNEMDGPWQAGHVPAAVYAQRAHQASFLMKSIDSGIQTVVCGSSGRGMRTYLEWDREVLEYCWDTVDYISTHRYSTNEQEDSAWFLAEGVEIDRILADYAALIGYVRGVKKSAKQVFLAFDEWNVWYRARRGEHVDGGWNTAPALLEEVYNLEDALVCAQYLAAFLRRADVVKIACLAQIVNVIAPILTRPDGILLQSIYYPFELFSRWAHGIALTPRVTSPEYAAGERGQVPALDAAAAYDAESGVLSVFAVNRDLRTELGVELEIADRAVTSLLGFEVLGGGDVEAANSWHAPDRVRPRPAEARLDGRRVRFTLPAPGFGALRLATSAR